MGRHGSDLARRQGVRTLSQENLLLFLCVHGGKHGWERLGWICDIAELIRIRNEMNWRTVMDQARALKSERMLLLGLYLASDLLEAPLPEEIRARVHSDPAVRSLATQVGERLFREVLPGVFESWRFQVRIRDRLWDGCRYCFGLVMTPTGLELTLIPLPALLFPLYYVLRPMRLVLKAWGEDAQKQGAGSKEQGARERGAKSKGQRAKSWEQRANCEIRIADREFQEELRAGSRGRSKVGAEELAAGSQRGLRYCALPLKLFAKLS